MGRLLRYVGDRLTSRFPACVNHWVVRLFDGQEAWGRSRWEAGKEKRWILSHELEVPMKQNENANIQMEISHSQLDT